MKHTLIQVDDFLPDPVAMRKLVIEGEFKTETGPDGGIYTGINKVVDESIFHLLAAALENKIIPRLSFWRLDYEGEKPHSFVHSDDICAGWAALIYLNAPEQCRGGTAFYRHLPTGSISMPSDAELEASGVDVGAFKEQMTKDWKTLEAWDFMGFVGMQFNRVVCYPTSMFHSRYPHEAFGKTPADGRLVGVVFFDFVP